MGISDTESSACERGSMASSAKLNARHNVQRRPARLARLARKIVPYIQDSESLLPSSGDTRCILSRQIMPHQTNLKAIA